MDEARSRAAAKARNCDSAFALSLAVLLAYLPALHGGFVWDDKAHVTAEGLRSLRGLFRIWFEPGATQQYYPLTHGAFWLEHRLFGDAPTGYHVVNLLLHATAAALAALVLRRCAVPGAWLAGAIFALHPVQVESAAWISEQKNTLSAVLYLSAALAWFAFEERRAKRWYALAVGLFVLGLAAKTVTATLPGALLVLAFWRRGRISWREDVVPLLPLFAAGIAAGVFSVRVERELVGARGAEFALSPAVRVLIAGRAFWFYLGKLAWPAHLAFSYPRWSIDARSPAQWLYPAAALALLAAAWALRRRSRAPLAAALFFAGTLLPALGFFDVYPFRFSFVADHFQYLACLGPIALAAALLTRVFERHKLRLPVLAAMVAGLAALTFKQSRAYADDETLYRATLEENPSSWMAWNNLAVVLLDRGAVDDALEPVQRALALRPDYPEGHNNLGLVLAGRGNPDGAIAEYLEALRFAPRYAEAHNNLAVALLSRGRAEEAVKHVELAAQLGVESYDLQNVAGIALAERGQFERAIDHLRRALKLRPDSAEAHNNLGNALVGAGRRAEAVAEFGRALELDPGSAAARRNLKAAAAPEPAGN